MKLSNFLEAQEIMNAQSLLTMLRHQLDTDQVVHLAVVHEDLGVIDYYGIDASDHPALQAMLRYEEQKNNDKLASLGLEIDMPFDVAPPAALKSTTEITAPPFDGSPTGKKKSKKPGSVVPFARQRRR